MAFILTDVMDFIDFICTCCGSKPISIGYYVLPFSRTRRYADSGLGMHRKRETDDGGNMDGGAVVETAGSGEEAEIPNTDEDSDAEIPSDALTAALLAVKLAFESGDFDDDIDDDASVPDLYELATTLKTPTSSSSTQASTGPLSAQPTSPELPALFIKIDKTWSRAVGFTAECIVAVAGRVAPSRGLRVVPARAESAPLPTCVLATKMVGESGEEEKEEEDKGKKRVRPLRAWSAW
ncbi:hypothetical protein BDK51DRAFT_40835 [Blyttiomyces helicus]|uniref:Uncharacterized protein n=1 Tax=Blyttiomyces helicus TaxID=388810 RepID=A0A4P9VVI9_9FUNG|nr:hypothetical protein BDK51DRAFT_40835 [Blyttiomyces helicus]|eukprot:RKO83669.1 hypothetical protein BDK51DRAFT_40835 [Blyttiomyces helicus]